MRTALTAFCLSVIAIMLFTGITAAQDSVVCPEGSAPTIDGTLDDGEWDDADNITLQVPLENECTVHYKYSGRNLYVAFQFEDGHTSNVPDTRVLLDTDNDMADSPQDDDYELYINPDNGGTRERKGNGNDWSNVDIEEWNGSWNDTDSDRWSTEYSISFSKLIGNGSDGVLGIGFVVYGNVGTSTGWPDGADEDTPSSWGNMTFAGSGPGVHGIGIRASALVDVVEGEDAVTTIVVSNSGSEAENVQLELGGDIVRWASLDIDEFTIEPQEEVTVNITISVPAGTEEGMYTVNVTATARSGATDTATIRVDVSASGGGGGGGGGDDDTPGFDLILVTMAVAVTAFFYRRR